MVVVGQEAKEIVVVGERFVSGTIIGVTPGEISKVMFFFCKVMGLAQQAVPK